MDFLMRLSAEHGALVVFLVVLLEQAGLPLPAYPVLLLTGGMAARGHAGLAPLLAAAVVASVLSDSAWYLAGQRHGRRVLRLLCRLSLTPDKCVRQTESLFARWGAPSLLVAKFVPGFASIATALAGTLRIPRGAFLLYDTLGAALWAGVGIGLGVLFSDAIEQVLQTLDEIGRWGLLLVLLGLAAFVLRRWWQRYRFGRRLRMDRMAVHELLAEIAGGGPLLIVDAQSPLGRSQGRIPGAVLFSDEACEATTRGHPRDALVVVYCACPNDVSAVLAARKLLAAGFTRVLPLAGGIDAWMAGGGAVVAPPAIPVAAAAA
ncbi:MAG: VTT domain-containing protein [Pseudomonadota bacterium]